MFCHSLNRGEAVFINIAEKPIEKMRLLSEQSHRILSTNSTNQGLDILAIGLQWPND
jgi:hypothetical protein